MGHAGGVSKARKTASLFIGKAYFFLRDFSQAL
jgi:hypothetical protein